MRKYGSLSSNSFDDVHDISFSFLQFFMHNHQASISHLRSLPNRHFALKCGNLEGFHKFTIRLSN